MYCKTYHVIQIHNFGKFQNSRIFLYCHSSFVAFMRIKIVYSTHYGYSIHPLLVKAIHLLSADHGGWNYGESITSFVFRSNNRETVRN